MEGNSGAKRVRQGLDAQHPHADVGAVTAPGSVAAAPAPAAPTSRSAEAGSGGISAVIDDWRQVMADMASRADVAMRAARSLSETEAQRGARLLAENAHLRADLAARDETVRKFLERFEAYTARAKQLRARINTLAVENDELRAELCSTLAAAAALRAGESAHDALLRRLRALAEDDDAPQGATRGAGATAAPAPPRRLSPMTPPPQKAPRDHAARAHPPPESTAGPSRAAADRRASDRGASLGPSCQFINLLEEPASDAAW